MENTLDKILLKLINTKGILSECQIYSFPELEDWKDDQKTIYDQLEKLFEEEKILKLTCKTPNRVDHPELSDAYGQAFYMSRD